MSGNPYYTGQSAAQLRVALSQDIATLYTLSGTIAAPAAPSALVGLAAIPGAAITFMRSDAAPALNQTITPTWSGAHTFSAGLSGTTGNFSGAISASNLSGTNTGDQSAANPTASVGLAAVNGAAATFMRSDAAPVLSQTITPTMTGLWTFNGKVVVGAPVSGTALTVTGVAATIGMMVSTPSDTQLAVNALTTGQFSTLQFTQNTSTLVGQVYTDNTGNTLNLTTNNAAGATIKFWPGTGVAAKATLSTSGLVLVNGLAINGISSPPAQPTGYGTPTGGAHQASFAAGAITLPNLAAAVAQLIIELKAYGIIGA